LGWKVCGAIGGFGLPSSRSVIPWIQSCAGRRSCDRRRPGADRRSGAELERHPLDRVVEPSAAAGTAAERDPMPDGVAADGLAVDPALDVDGLSGLDDAEAGAEVRRAIDADVARDGELLPLIPSPRPSVS
jgi:hypothetical protein